MSVLERSPEGRGSAVRARFQAASGSPEARKRSEVASSLYCCLFPEGTTDCEPHPDTPQLDVITQDRKAQHLRTYCQKGKGGNKNLLIPDSILGGCLLPVWEVFNYESWPLPPEKC